VVAGPARGGVAPPGAPDEAQRVGRAITHRAVRVFTGSAATESTIRGALVGASVIHLAAHARPNVTAPDFAEVWLAPDSASDGRLQALEIRGLDLHGSTVVLSACETGLGRVAGGEGPISLARAFVQAGAGHVVATLWPVRESAGALMEAFHARLDRGLDPSSALREAKVLLLRRGAAPLDLAPFIILGSRR
jgi:CHAT domain-containing protein